MKLHLLTYYLLIPLVFPFIAYAQPANDEPCNAIYLGHFDAENRYVSITGNNIGATVSEEAGGEDPNGIVLNDNDAVSCLEERPWQNTVWYYFTYDFPFHKRFFTQLTSISGTFNFIEMLSQNLCPVTRDSEGEVSFVIGRSNCSLGDGQGAFHGYCIDEAEYARFPRSIRGTIYVLISSNSDAEEGEFELEVFLPEPTYCNGCQDQNETVEDGPYTFSDISVEDEDAGAANGSITIDEVTGGNQPLTYSIDGINFQSETIFENLEAGTYIVTVRDINDCIATQQVEIEEILPDIPIITPPEIACEGEEQVATAIGQNIRWYSDAALNNSIGEGNELRFLAGTYTVVYATQNPSGVESNAASAPVAFIALPEVTIEVQGNECSAELTAIISPMVTNPSYQWFKDDVAIEEAVTTNTATTGAGSYTVQVSFQECVVLSAPVEITGNIPDDPVIENPPTYCEGDLIQPIEATSNGEITWYADEALTNSAGTGNSFTPSNLTETTTFYAQAQLGNCTSNPVVVTVEISPRPTANIIAPTPCVGETLTAETNLTEVIYQWFLNGQEILEATTAEFIPMQAGEYSVRISKEGCETISDPIIIAEVPQPPELLSETTFCNTVSEITVEARSNYEIQWFTDANLSQLVNTGNSYTSTNITSQLLWLQAVNGECVSEVTQVTISVSVAPTVTIQLEGNGCVGDLLVANVSQNDAIISWFRGEELVPDKSSLTFTPEQAGTYTAQASLGDCFTISNEIVINEYPSIPNVIPPPIYCEGDEIRALEASSTGEITWFADATLTTPLQMGNSFQPENLTGTTTFWLQAQNANCLSDTNSVTLNINSTPKVTITAPAFCVGTLLQAEASGTGNFTYQWFRNDIQLGEETANNFTPNQAGSYRVEVSANGCSTLSTPVVINPIPVADAGEVQSVCLGENILLRAQNIVDSLIYQWLDANDNVVSSTAGATVTPTDTTFYQLRVTDNAGCSALDRVVVNVDDTPVQAGFTVPFQIGYAPLEVPFTDQSQFADTVFWDFADGTVTTERNPTYTFEEVGEYEVIQQVSANGICFREDTVLIRVVEPLVIPNGISPNGDGVNDQWIIENIDLFSNHTIKVFNQWGNLVFEAANYQNDWEGDNLPDATYFYVITLEENIPDAKGYLMILR